MGGMAVCPSCPKFYTFCPDEIVNDSVDAKKKKKKMDVPLWDRELGFGE